jgi:hypothetical protein
MSMKNNLKKIRYWAVLVAGFAGLVVSGLLYSPLLFGNAYMHLRGIDPRSMANMKFPVWEMLGEFAHDFVIAFVVAYFVAALGVRGWKGGMQLGLWLWFGFWAMVLMGSVIHEHMPLELYAIHATDGLIKIVVMAVILSVWRSQRKEVMQ